MSTVLLDERKPSTNWFLANPQGDLCFVSKRPFPFCGNRTSVTVKQVLLARAAVGVAESVIGGSFQGTDVRDSAVRVTAALAFRAERDGNWPVHIPTARR